MKSFCVSWIYNRSLKYNMSAPNYEANCGNQVNASQFYAALNNGAGGATQIQSPLAVVNANGPTAVTITAVANGSASVVASSTAVTAATAVLQLGVPASATAITIDNNAAQDRLTVGRSGVTGLRLSSAATAGGAMAIVGDDAQAANTITIGPNSNAPSCVVVGPGNAFTVAASPYTSQTVVPQLANGTGVIPGNSGVVLTNPGTAGLYYIGVSCSTLDGPSVASQIFTIAFYDGAKWKVGGIAEGVVGTGGVTLSPAPGTAATINFFNNSGGNLVDISFLRIPIFNGQITGFP
jgi:hypothetical protein